MTNGKEKRTRDLAYRLWELQGFPEGRELDHWHKARAQIEREECEERKVAKDVKDGSQTTDQERSGTWMAGERS
jgi:hypothetical protein